MYSKELKYLDKNCAFANKFANNSFQSKIFSVLHDDYMSLNKSLIYYFENF